MPLKSTQDASTYFSVTDTASFRDMLTFACWFRLDTSNSSGGNRHLMSKGQNASGSQQFLAINVSNLLLANMQWSTTASSVSSGTALTLGKIYFGCATYDTSSKVNTLYLGDVLAQPRDVTTIVTGNPGSGTHSSDSGVNFYCMGNPVNAAQNPPATVFAAATFLNVLKANEVIALWDMSRKHPAYALLANVGDGSMKASWLPGSNGSATVVDLSRNGNTGTITGAIPTADQLPMFAGSGAFMGVQ